VATTTKYTMHHSTVLDTGPDEVWAEVRDVVRMVKILFDGVDANPRWAEGGELERIPSRYDFVLPTGDLVEQEVAGRDEVTRSVCYRTVARVLCLYDYVGNYRVHSVTTDPGRSFFEFRREFMITEDADPAVVEALVTMMRNQINVLRDYFATPTGQ
jgi:hypothetical protein